MSRPIAASIRKRPVDPALSDELLQQATSFSPNPSATAEGMQGEYVARERDARAARQRAAADCCAYWNAARDACGGSLADEHSTL